MSDLTKDEAFEVTLLAMIEAMANTIKDRHKVKSRRWNQAEGLRERAHKVNDTYIGTMPERFIGKAEKFYEYIEADINGLLNGYKGE